MLSLFFSWDSEFRGAVDKEEMERELSLYKDGAEEGASQRGQRSRGLGVGG